MSKRLDLDYFKALATERGGQCLSDIYANNHTHLKWVCEYGHEWTAAPKMIKKGQWCPHCYNQTENRRAAKKDLNKIAEVKTKAIENGGKCLSNEYVNNESQLKFICDKGHEWETNWKCIFHGSWCPECSNHTATDSKIQQIQAAIIDTANARGGKALTDYTNGHTKILWECSLGHRWEATYSNVVHNKSWCPLCSSGLSERICRLTFESLFGVTFNKARPIWLRNSNNKWMELDGFNPELMLAFEHHGAQHYRITHDFIKTEIQLEDRQRDDLIKERLCNLNGVRLIIIPELFKQTHPNDLKDIILNKANEFVIDVPNAHLNIDVNYFYNKEPELQKHLKDINDITQTKGGECLESIYISCSSPMKFKCAQGHIWTTSATRIKIGHWCPACANKILKTIRDAQNLADPHGGKCLSETYIDSQTHLTWQCNQGHIWNASYNAIQSGTWCPTCSIKIRAKKKTLSIEPYREAAIRKGGKLLSTEYNGCYDKLEWQCGAGHVFKYRADQIKNTNKWCPMCWRKKTVKDNDNG